MKLKDSRCKEIAKSILKLAITENYSMDEIEGYKEAVNELAKAFDDAVPEVVVYLGGGEVCIDTNVNGYDTEDCYTVDWRLTKARIVFDD